MEQEVILDQGVRYCQSFLSFPEITRDDCQPKGGDSKLQTDLHKLQKEYQKTKDVFQQMIRDLTKKS